MASDVPPYIAQEQKQKNYNRCIHNEQYGSEQEGGKVMRLTHDDQLDKAVCIPMVRAETEPKHADKWGPCCARKRCSFTRHFTRGKPCLLFRPVEAGSGAYAYLDIKKYFIKIVL